MLINLVPDFFAVLDSTDRVAAYLQYYEAHRRILEPYWANYVLDPDGPHFQEVVRATVHASRDDLRTMLDRVDVITLARAAETESRRVLEADVDVDVVLMVGVGAEWNVVAEGVLPMPTTAIFVRPLCTGPAKQV